MLHAVRHACNLLTGSGISRPLLARMLLFHVDSQKPWQALDQHPPGVVVAVALGQTGLDVVRAADKSVRLGQAPPRFAVELGCRRNGVIYRVHGMPDPPHCLLLLPPTGSSIQWASQFHFHIRRAWERTGQVTARVQRGHIGIRIEDDVHSISARKSFSGEISLPRTLHAHNKADVVQVSFTPTHPPFGIVAMDRRWLRTDVCIHKRPRTPMDPSQHPA